MKKVFSLMLLLATMLTFTACSSDDEPENGISKADLIGLWDATAVQPDGAGKWVDITNRPDLALSISFYEDGSYYGEGALGDGEGTYTLNGNTIKTYIDGELYGTYIVNSLVGDNAELTLTMGGETIGIRAKKSKISFAPSDPSIVAYNFSDGDINVYSHWQVDEVIGNSLTFEDLQFSDFGIAWWDVNYCTILNGTGFIHTCVDGTEYICTVDNSVRNEYQYYYDGKTLVMRNLDNKEEKVFTAIVNGNKLTLSDGSNTTVYTKISEQY